MEMNKELSGSFFQVPKIGRGALYVWVRNFYFFKNTWFTSIFWIGFEPVLYLLAFGLGMGRLVGPIEDGPYIEFFTPALLVMTSMFVAFYEGSFSSQQRRKNLKTVLLSPVTEEEVVFGEILWAASKSFLSVCLLMTLAFIGGLVLHWQAVPALFVLWVCCWLFAALGVSLQSVDSNQDRFIYAQSGLIIPMALFCSTYFPLSVFPVEIQKVLWTLPLTHAVSSVRNLMQGEWPLSTVWQFAYLILLAAGLTVFAVSRVTGQLRDDRS